MGRTDYERRLVVPHTTHDVPIKAGEFAPIAPSDRTFDDLIASREEWARILEQSRTKLDTILRNQIQPCCTVCGLNIGFLRRSLPALSFTMECARENWLRRPSSTCVFLQGASFVTDELRLAGILVQRRAIFLDGGVDGQEKEFLFGLCAGHEEFDIMWNVW